MYFLRAVSVILLFNIYSLNSQTFDEFLEKAASGDAYSQAIVGEMYWKGDGIEKNIEKAKEWFERSVEQGNPYGIFNLALLYQEEPFFVEKKRLCKSLFLQAISGFSQLCGADDHAACNYVGIIYDYGYGVETDKTEAAKWYHKSAEKGYVFAQFKLGVFYDFGKGVESNKTEAAKWYLKAASQGHIEAQYNIAVCYDNGEGIPENKREAVKWYLKAAEQGHISAQYNIAVCYEKGEGISLNKTQAAKWYVKAAENGNAGACNNLGLLYLGGQGVKQDPVKAYAYFLLGKAMVDDLTHDQFKTESTENLSANCKKLKQELTTQEQSKAEELATLMWSKIQQKKVN